MRAYLHDTLHKTDKLIWCSSSIYDASNAVNEWVEALEDTRSELLRLQTKNGVAVSVTLLCSMLSRLRGFNF